MSISLSKCRSALKGFTTSYNLTTDSYFADSKSFLLSAFDLVNDIISTFIGSNASAKLQLRITVHFLSSVDPNKDATAHFSSKQTLVLVSDNFEVLYGDVIEQIDKKIDEFQKLSSGWRVESIIDGSIHLARYDPLSGACHVDLPAEVKFKTSVVNIVNDDNKCFVWSVLAGIFKSTTASGRTKLNSESYTNRVDYLNLTTIKFPFSVDQSAAFEQQNPTVSISIFAFDQETRQFFVAYVTREIKTHHVNLLLIQFKDHSHYCLITNLGMFFNKITRHKTRKIMCPKCLAVMLIKNRVRVMFSRRYRCLRKKNSNFHTATENCAHRASFTLISSVYYRRTPATGPTKPRAPLRSMFRSHSVL